MTRKELADKCRAWRLAMGITQAEIADKAGTSSQAVSQFENGSCNSLRIYCAYLDYGYKSDWTQGAAMMGVSEDAID